MKGPSVYGVQRYSTGKTETTVYFPNQDVVCRWCELYLRYERDFRRYSCRLTGEWIVDPEHEIGEKCPLKITEEHSSSQAAGRSSCAIVATASAAEEE